MTGAHHAGRGDLLLFQVALEPQEPPNLQSQADIGASLGHVLLQPGQPAPGLRAGRSIPGQVGQQPEGKMKYNQQQPKQTSPAITMAGHSLVLGQAHSQHSYLEMRNKR